MTGDEERADGMMSAERVVRQIARNYDEQAARAQSGSEKSYYEAASGVASQCAKAVGGARSVLAGGSGPTEELGRLATYITRWHAGEIRQGETAVDAAIRLLRQSS